VNNAFVRAITSTLNLRVISRFRREADKTCDFLGYVGAVLDASLRNALQNITKRIYLNINQLDAPNFITSLFHAST